ncbi:MAG TPA: hypothetical protein VG205_01120 [Acidimicrobiales bacterium]|jgi:hypothetical protein|nr:hypothetical protein [Acidimicrobiales bacterium]
MGTPVSVLDEALDRVSALDFAVPNPFVSHGPMACEALDALGFDAVIGDWVRGFESSMGEAVQPVTPRWGADFEWKDALGDYRLLPEWMGYFGRAIDADGWSSVVEVWLPRLMPGLVAALFHGVIRTSHAVRALQGADTPARRAELARALGNWAVWLHPGQPADHDPGVGHLDETDDPRRAAMAAAADGARCYIAAPTVFNLHGVTGATAVGFLSSSLSAADGAAAIAQLRAEHASLYRGVTRSRIEDGGYRWDHQVAVVAAESFDSHQVKLVEACRRGFELTGDGAFVLAAETVTGSHR